jgi:hypothetical protein
MRCTTAREHGRAWMVGARSPRLMLAALAHLARCPQCRQELRHIRQLRMAARDLPSPSFPVELRARVLAEIATAPVPALASETTADAHKRRWSRMIQRTVILGVGLATAVGALLLSSRSPHRGGVLALGNVRKALEHVNTWHLKGWQRQGDREVPWEVWGRRNPFFYHERIGEQETLDDGNSRTIVLPPNKFYLTKQTVVLKMPSRPNPESSTGLAYVLGLEQQPDNTVIKPWSRDAETETYRSEESISISNPAIQANGLLTFQPDSPLPLRYERLMRAYHVQTDAHGAYILNDLPDSAVTKHWIGVHLDAQYDLDLDASAYQIAMPADALLIDAVRDAAAPTMPTQNTTTQNGLTVHLTQGLMDTKGDVLLRFEMFVGSVNCRNAGLPFGSNMMLCSGDIKDDQGQWHPSGYPDSLVARDERGRSYVAINNLEFVNNDWMAFAPLVPLKTGEPLPRRLACLLNVGLSMITSSTDIDLGGGRTSHAVTGRTDLMHERMNVEVELAFTPHRIDVLDLSRRYGHLQDVANGFATDYTAAAAEARARAWQSIARNTIERALNEASIAAERKEVTGRQDANVSKGRGIPSQSGGYMTVPIHLDSDKELEVERMLQRASYFADEAARLSPRTGQGFKVGIETLRQYFNAPHTFRQFIKPN